MIMTNFLKNRRSVRDFRNKKVSPEVLDNIKVTLKELENEFSTGNIKFRLYEYGENIYKGLKGIAGYSGVMIESPHYIAIDLNQNEDKTVIYCAYYMEKLITNLNKLGLDTCWVSVLNVDKDKRKEIFGESTGEINYILAFGYSKRNNPFVQEPFSERIGVEEMVYNKEIGKTANMIDLEERGLADIFFYLRFAPSIKNLQPWRFILSDDKVHLLVKYEDGQNPPLIDAGIVMYYFEALANLQGVNNKWSLLDGLIHKEDNTFRYIAEFQL